MILRVSIMQDADKVTVVGGIIMYRKEIYSINKLLQFVKI